MQDAGVIGRIWRQLARAYAIVVFVCASDTLNGNRYNLVQSTSTLRTRAPRTS